MVEGVAESLQHQYHASRPGAWTIILRWTKATGVYTPIPYIHISSLRLFTQLTRLVLRKRVGFAMRGPTPAHVCTTRTQLTSEMRSERFRILHGRWNNGIVYL